MRDAAMTRALLELGKAEFAYAEALKAPAMFGDHNAASQRRYRANERVLELAKLLVIDERARRAGVLRTSLQLATELAKNEEGETEAERVSRKISNLVIAETGLSARRK